MKTYSGKPWIVTASATGNKFRRTFLRVYEQASFVATGMMDAGSPHVTGDDDDRQGF
ncbi:hypothetical protein [Schlesneria paludicola]|uniref:hypothetical protein n=1 Tax=Schlesneria paludicola TaxID=360056 RepID=UPI0002EC42E8|nr:hypothetical protein [Schlesneria paludicola]